MFLATPSPEFPFWLEPPGAIPYAGLNLGKGACIVKFGSLPEGVQALIFPQIFFPLRLSGWFSGEGGVGLSFALLRGWRLWDEHPLPFAAGVLLQEGEVPQLQSLISAVPG
ncbi:hypothetical protein PSPO01_16590 [Paraphaeosphaeria sporulosa]